MKEALAAYNSNAFSKLNRDFHAILYSYCPNQFILKNIQQMRERLEAVRKTSFILYPQRVPQSLKEHNVLIDMLRTHLQLRLNSYALQHKLNTGRIFDENLLIKKQRMIS